jgi:hypothetical protein
MERIGFWKRLHDPLYDNREQYYASFPPSPKSLTIKVDPNELSLAYRSMRILGGLINGKPGNCVFIPPFRDDDGVAYRPVTELITENPAEIYYRGYLYADLDKPHQGRVEASSIPLPVLLNDQDTSIVAFLTRINSLVYGQLKIVPQSFVKHYLRGRLDEYDCFMYERGKRYLHKIYSGPIRKAINKPWCLSADYLIYLFNYYPPPDNLTGGYEAYWKYLLKLKLLGS